MFQQKPRLYCDNKLGSGCDYHRIVMPFADNTIQPKENVLVFNRIFSNGVEEVKRLKSRGVKIVLDLDDFYELNPEHYLAGVFTSHTQTIKEMILLADVVIVTTEYLAYKIRPLNKNVVVIRNALPFDTQQFTLSTDRDSDTLLIWAGGASHEADLSLVANTFDGELLTIAGYEVYPSSPQGSSQRLTTNEWNKVRRKQPNAQYKPAVKNLGNYMSVYDGHAVAIAPLVDNEFNKCKSNLKILEAGAKGLPIICSKVLPYYNPVDANVVTYAESKAEWHYEVVKLQRNPNYAFDRGMMLAEHVRTHYNLADANELRRQVIESL